MNLMRVAEPNVRSNGAKVDASNFDQRTFLRGSCPYESLRFRVRVTRGEVANFCLLVRVDQCIFENEKFQLNSVPFRS